MLKVHQFCFITALSFASAQAAASPPAQTGPSPFHGFYNGPDGIFSYASSAQEPNSDLTQISDSVCNLNPNENLIFQWNDAGFGTGLFRPLPVGYCMTQSEYGSGYSRHYNAPITFTQHDETTHASAYVPTSGGNQDIQLDIAPSHYDNSEASIVKLTIRFRSDGSGNIAYDMTWTGWDDGNAIMVLSLPSGIIREIRSQIQSDGWDVIILDGPPALDPEGYQAEAEDYARLGVSDGDTAIEMRPVGNPSFFHCHFGYDSGDANTKPGVFAVANRQNNIVAIARLPTPN